VAFDQHKVIPVLDEPLRAALEDLGVLRPDVGLVEVEVDRA
jgi:hypothetical protein